MRLLTFFLLFPLAFGFSQTIEEKKAASLKAGSEAELDQFLDTVNSQLGKLRDLLAKNMQKAEELYRSEADQDQYEIILDRVKVIRAQMDKIQDQWRRKAVIESDKGNEGYALWDQDEVMLSNLIMEFGATDYLYIIPPEMMKMRITMHSAVPIPRAAWDEVLEIILAQNGVGVKKINPYAKQLFIFKHDPSAVTAIASSLEDIAHFEDSRRIFFVFSPPPEHVKSVFQFFERFSDPKACFVYNLAGKIAIVATKKEIHKLINLYSTVWSDPDNKISKVVPVTKMPVKEMEKILTSFFKESLARPTTRAPFGKMDHTGLSIMTPSGGNALVLMGSRKVVERAEKVIKDTENQLQDPAEMTIYIYTCKHSDPNDLAKVLDKVYYSLLHAIPGVRENIDVNYTARGSAIQNPPDGYSPAPPLTVPPQQFKPEIDSRLQVEEQDSEHFIADPKTGTILMVVRRDVLNRIKDLLKRLDVPKKMVQIEVLLFEKKLTNQANYGLNLLKLGNDFNGSRYDGPNPPGPKGLGAPVGNGVLAFLFSGGKSKHFPAFDFAYSFLMTQEDIQLNAAPSVITVNQTPATISILEEISIDNGAAPIDTNKGIAFQKSFTRAQYGINIILTPIIHLPGEDDEDQDQRFVTLQTNITFDTTRASRDDRPAVDRRHIENEVRVFDGQTVIIGGLRRKAVQDNINKVPFLGEIPGIGKLFGSSQLTDSNTEMFFFITPRIISDPKEELHRELCCQLQRRPGDLPCYLKRLIEARECERKRLFSSSIRAFFGEKQQYYE